jgi:hypothetical protein
MNARTSVVPALVALVAGATLGSAEVGAQVSCDPDYPCPTTPHITVTNPEELRTALVNAVPGTVVQVPASVSMSLDGIAIPLPIQEGVTLYGGRGVGPNDRGALIRIDRVDENENAMFEIVGNDAAIRGLRLRGPSASTDESNPVVDGIRVDDRFSATITGNELYNWTGAAVRVDGGVAEPGATCAPNPGSPPYRAVIPAITDNYIHHNQRNREGYGVGVYDGAIPLVEGNTFDWNRHSISGDGHPQTGYYARYNYVLSGGSRYGAKLTYKGSYMQHFDMHGDDNYGDGEDTNDGYGGDAGDLVEILGNTVHGEQRYGTVLGFGGKTRAVYWLRGRPCRRHQLRGNVLVHDEDKVVVVKGVDIHVGEVPPDRRSWYTLTGNRYDTDTSWSLGVGDFDRDGRDDLSQPTGAAWYYSSGGVREWRLLQKGRTETMDRLRLGDFDGDRDTDVFKAGDGEWLISRGGTESWERAGTSALDNVDRLRFGDFDGDGRTDVFRASGSRWYYSPGAAAPWRPLAMSSFRIEDVRFGNFDGDAITDVFGIEGGRWAVKDDGRSPWRRLNSLLTDDLDSLVFADFDGDGRTDVAQSRRVGLGILSMTIEWRVSWRGTSAWRTLRRFTVPLGPSATRAQLYRHWIGRFDSSPGADAVRYQPGALFEGVQLVRSSGARGNYVPHSSQGMR